MKKEKPKKGEIVIYKAKGGPIIDVRLQQKTVWLTQKEMTHLFDHNLSDWGEHEIRYLVSWGTGNAGIAPRPH